MKSLIRKFGLAAFLTGFCAPVLAGGPIAQCTPDQAFAWSGGGASIPYNPDIGDLVVAGDNASAVQLVADAFQVWQDVETATATYTNAGPLPEDVTGANVLTYWAEPAPDGLSPIIFDFDGSAGATLGFPAGVLGVAGIAWVNTVTCDVTEGAALLIGPTFAGNPVAAFDVTVHEFGHYSGLGHTVVNGQIYLGSVGGDTSGPTPNGTFDPVPDPFTEVVETMYPFYFGPPIGTASLHKDDIATLSELYPAASLATDFGSIVGTVSLGDTPVTGANVIARNIADPYFDAVSAISGDFSLGVDASTGLYNMVGLTPGADYAVYVDEILAGGFSTPLLSPLPGPEEFYNGANESADSTIDDPAVFTPVAAVAGVPTIGIDIIFNQPGEGESLAVGDDGSIQLSLPFEFCVKGQAFSSVYVNANGNLTFGAANGDFSETNAEFSNGPPRVAGLWDDLQPFDVFGNPQGSVFYNQTNDSFTVTWDNVPEFGFPVGVGSNTFSITLKDNSRDCTGHNGHRSYYGYFFRGADVVLDYGQLDALDGIAGVSGGLAVSNGVEQERDLTSISRDGRRKIRMFGTAALFENFDELDGDLSGIRLKFDNIGRAFRDRFERNDSLRRAKYVRLPFDTINTRRRYSAIDPAADDVDFYRFRGEGGQTLIADILQGQIDSVMGLYYCPPAPRSWHRDDDDDDDDAGWHRWRHGFLDRCDSDTAVLIDFNDDANGLLSSLQTTLPITGTYALAVTFCCDFDFDGMDAGQGAPLDGGRYVLSVQQVDGVPLPLGDETVLDLTGFGFEFPYNGTSHSNIFVSSNGFISLGSPEFDFSPSIAEFEAGAPRVAPLWADLDATNSLVLFNSDFASELTIKFIDVPEFGGIGANNFSVTLRSNGDIEYDYGAVTASPLIGAAEGGGEPSTATDFSAVGGGMVGDSPVELFDIGNPYDLADPDTITIVP